MVKASQVWAYETLSAGFESKPPELDSPLREILFLTLEFVSDFVFRIPNLAPACPD
jgi:hypothetical protein